MKQPGSWQRPRFMWRSRFRAITQELRTGKPKACRKHVYKGRERWERLLPPPMINEPPQPSTHADAR